MPEPVPTLYFVPINEANLKDSVHLLINNIEEGKHDFVFYNYNEKGKRSDPFSIYGVVYGEQYEAKLINRPVTKAVLESDENLVINWGSLKEAAGVELSYKNIKDETVELIIPKGEAITILRNYKRSSAFEYRTLYKPQPRILDVFYSSIKNDVPIHEETLLKGTVKDRILANSNLIGNLTSNITVNSYPGLQETYLKFIDYKGRPQALFVLEVDLNNEQISVEAGTPNDGAVYGTSQTVSQIISSKNSNNIDKKVIAAVNADYFTIATGIPLGPTIKNGVETKLFNRASEYYYLGILKSNLSVIGNKSSYSAHFSNMKEALGAFHLLVSNGDLQGQADVSIAPRTTVGVIGTSKLIFLVVDGRQAGYSQGLSLAEIGQLHQAIGVKNAVNLDGGGSTTFIVRNDQDKYEVKNSLSDGTQRRVANAWLILQQTP